MKKFQPGILGNSIKGWELLFQQEGVPYSVAPKDLSVSEMSALIIADDADKNYDKDIIQYLNNGGAILCSAEIFKRITGEKVIKKYIKYLQPDSRFVFNRNDLVDIEKTCIFLEKSNYMLNDLGRHSVYLGEYGAGWVAVMPFDCGSLYLDQRISPKSFFGNKKRLPHEVVSTVSKGGVRILFKNCLEYLHHIRKIPYIHLWYYQKPENSCFIFRIDTDYATLIDVQKIYKLLHEFDINATWFVDVKSQYDLLSLYSTMKNHEISLHGYEHKIYRDYYKNNLNIKEGIRILKEHGISPPGFASPYGKWNYELARAIFENGFEYSSEFSYDYDNLPSYPFIGAGFNTVLEIPIHPVSIGTLRRQGYDAGSMKEYYKTVIDNHLNNRIPVILYYHPRDGNHEVLSFVFSYIKEKSISNITMAQFARWWKQRNEMRFEIFYDENTISIKENDNTNNGLMRISREDGAESYVNISSHIDLNSLKWQKIQSMCQESPNLTELRRYNPWILINRIEDMVHRVLK